MRIVTKTEFFATIGPLNVHPSPRGNYDHAAGGYLTEWKKPDGQIVGMSIGELYRLA